MITADVYAEYRKLTEAAKKGKMHPNSGNDLMAAAIRLFPQIADVAKKLRQAAGESRMSGSGACLFASFGGMKAALRARAVFGADFPVTIVGGLSHHPLGNMNAKNLMGSSQVVRQRVLIPPCVGSNPTSPAQNKEKHGRRT